MASLSLKSRLVDRAVESPNRNSSQLHVWSQKRKKCGRESGQATEDCLLTVTLWGALGDSEMTGQQVRLWLCLMLGLEGRLDV
jgi:hypothetical protein